jgi:hypothetical protein
MKICFLTKIEKAGVKEAIDYLKTIVKEIDVYPGNSTNPFPEEVLNNNCVNLQLK